MIIIDAILYNGERDIFDLRYNILKDYVDEFVVVEFGETFSGNKKEAHPINLPKVSYHFFTTQKDLKSDTPALFKQEYNQREMIKNCLIHLDDEDTIYMGDCDEIWKPWKVIPKDYWAPIGYKPSKYRLTPYTYYLNNRSNEDFPLGPVVGRYKDLKNDSLNRLRSETPPSKDYLGWHFTNMGGHDNLKYKIQSYSDQQFNQPAVHQYLSTALEHNVDYLGRPFKLWVDESDWPEYLKKNREQYKHLLK